MPDKSGVLHEEVKRFCYKHFYNKLQLSEDLRSLRLWINELSSVFNTIYYAGKIDQSNLISSRELYCRKHISPY